jgi:hypothetical protein
MLELEGKRPFEKQKNLYVDNIKMDFKVIIYEVLD